MCLKFNLLIFREVYIDETANYSLSNSLTNQLNYTNFVKLQTMFTLKACHISLQLI